MERDEMQEYFEAWLEMHYSLTVFELSEADLDMYYALFLNKIGEF